MPPWAAVCPKEKQSCSISQFPPGTTASNHLKGEIQPQQNSRRCTRDRTRVGLSIRRFWFSSKSGFALINDELHNILCAHISLGHWSDACAKATSVSKMNLQCRWTKALCYLEARENVANDQVSNSTLVEESIAGEQFISISQTFRSESITRSYLHQCMRNEAGISQWKMVPKEFEWILASLNGVLPRQNAVSAKCKDSEIMNANNVKRPITLSGASFQERSCRSMYHSPAHT
jgi:hypothetical protein